MKKPAMKTRRMLVVLLFVVLTCVGLAFHTGTGTLSQFGIGPIAALCPLGGIEAALASKTLLPFGLLGMGIVVVLTLAFGRFFCSWVCPTALVRSIFGVRSPHERRLRDKEKGKLDQGKAKPARKSCAECRRRKDDDCPDPERGGVHDSRLWVLGGVCVSTAILGFPVFCLVCPIGLSFATVIALWRALRFGESAVSFLVFLAIVVLEVVVFRRWCHAICPLGALLSLLSRGNKTFRVELDASRCVQKPGEATCNRCVDVCPEGIDMHPGALSTPSRECVKCGECVQACPAKAIRVVPLPKAARLPRTVGGGASGERVAEGDMTVESEERE